MLAKEIFSFPHPVNDYAARAVAGMVSVMAIFTVVFQLGFMLPVLTLGFAARVLTGPTLSPAGQLATRVIVPMLGNRTKMVAGPPKRFAQAIGLLFTLGSTGLYFVGDNSIAAFGLIAVLTIFALLESVLGFCTGCFVFNLLMKTGIIPTTVCEKCNNLFD